MLFRVFCEYQSSHIIAFSYYEDPRRRKQTIAAFNVTSNKVKALTWKFFSVLYGGAEN